MKRIKNIGKACIDITEVDIIKYYGVVSWADKGFINREYYNRGKFKINTFDAITNGNGWSNYGCNNLENFIRILLEDAFWVYEFDTWQELLEWAITK